MGVKKEEEPAEGKKGEGDQQQDSFSKAAVSSRPEEEEEEDDGGDYKSKARYSDHMSKPNEAASEFARTKTIAEQRAFLPIYGCR
eukprot:CAMPEP_0181245070 /NCGR_PEP_ID=MMETSP1096-20121128/43214_1 /TAXON_ID=156174 ORGANISM="Chrysochromulina ericina, Strain CCMP281" /NCGR_SAMPLE_ID=MMETSP1096 /ASSEMBLY_ACC=CAM_ASM_000453 /LENGTH=84 /DNA_ID=CAMNT_0023341695 /DNA_START=13 /DNA_END=264 /DNA_ORIENTATION=+